MAEGSGFQDLSRYPSWERYKIGAASIVMSKDDPEDTLMLSLTEREVALFAFGNMVSAFLFPEFQQIVGRTNKKLIEVSNVQQFLDFEAGELDELLGEDEE